MKSLPVKEIKVTGFFDLETYMHLSGHTRMDGTKAREIEDIWRQALNYLRVYQLGLKKGFVIIYLDSGFEQEMDQQKQDAEILEEYQMVAQALIMTSLLEVIPEAEIGACAPIPEPNKILKRSLQPLGLEISKQGVLNVRWGLITPFPYKSDCEKCHGKDSCARRLMQQPV